MPSDNMFCAVAIACALFSVSIAGPLCYQCDHVTTPTDCHKGVECSDSQRCFTQKMMDFNNNTYYKLGCENDNVCQTLPISLLGKRDVIVQERDVIDQEPHQDKTRQANHMSVCLHCCAGDGCNHKGGCGSDTGIPIPTKDPGTPLVLGVLSGQLTASSFWGDGYNASNGKLNNTETCWCTPLVLGVLSGQLTASSFWGDGYNASNGKLNNTETCWCVEDGQNKTAQWIQVDFLHKIQATSVITKGDPGYNEWVTSYKILKSSDCVTFDAITDGQGNDIIFTGNVDNDSEASNSIVPPVTCRCLRIHPLTYSSNVSVRFEVMGHVVGNTTATWV